MEFLKENWPWLLVPVLLFIAAVVVLLLLGDPEPAGSHEYNL